MLSVRVPNEDDRAATTKVRLSFPAGFQSVSYEAQAGWKAKVDRRRAGETAADRRRPRLERGRRDRLDRQPQGDRADCARSVPRLPHLGEAAGEGRRRARRSRRCRPTRTAPVVRWTGAADADKPAPTLRLTAAESAHGSSAGRAPARAAHAGVVSRTPARAPRASNVKRVAITFAEQLITGKIDVYRGGKRVAPASSGPGGATVAARFGRKLASGSYTAKWRAVASDGHVQTGLLELPRAVPR